jgi:hypothetical protein
MPRKTKTDPLSLLRPLARTVGEAGKATAAAIATLARHLAEAYPPIEDRGPGKRRVPAEVVDTLASDASVTPGRVRQWIGFGDRIIAAVRAGKPVPAERETTTAGRRAKLRKAHHTAAKPTDAKPTDAKPTDAKPTDSSPIETEGLARQAIASLAHRFASVSMADYLRKIADAIDAKAAPKAKAKAKSIA